MARRVLLIGQGPTAASALGSLLERVDVVGLVRAERDEVAAVAARAGAQIVTDTSLASVAALTGELAPDCVVVSSYDRVLPARLLDRCPFVNVHFAPLPELRGRATVNWAIIERRAETALTIHVLVPELDAGPILFQHPVPISEQDTVTDVYVRLEDLLRRHLGAVVGRHLDGYRGIPQDHAAATYACTRVPADGEIDWTRTTADISALIRALDEPFPGAFTHLRGRRLVVWRATPAPSPRHWAGRVPGRVVGCSAGLGWVDVLTGDGVLRLETVQVDGDVRRPAAEIITSVRATLGLRTIDLVERIRALELALSVHDQPAIRAVPRSARGG